MAEQSKLLELTSDFVFRTLFTRSPNSLIDLINSVLEFKGEQKIKGLTLQPPELPKDYLKDKSGVLDIKAQSHSGEFFNIELQAIEQSFYRDRALYYWAKLYASQLVQGQQYTKLQNTYSINFLNFNLLDISEYKSCFLILEKNNPHIQLTERFQMMFFELPKFEKHLREIDDNLELWLYVIKNTSLLDEDKMRMIVDKNPAMQETLGELKQLSLDPEILSLEEMRRKSRMDYESTMADREARGEARGKTEGIAEGEARGKTESMEKVAKAMFMEGDSIPKIAKVTGLSEKELGKLKSQIDRT